MAGRGRGKATGTLTQEQLQSMGVTRNEIQTVSAAAPPPLYPMLLSKPVPLESNPDRDYKILWKEDFISFLRESPYYTTLKSTKGPMERYSDKVVNVIENDPKRKKEGEILWNLMPSELKPTYKRTKPAQAEKGAKRVKDAVDVAAKLSALEQKESSQDDTEVKREKQSDSEEEKENEELEEDMADEEMDDENDYGNNYFDNGEAYHEEDDNLDDGPVY